MTLDDELADVLKSDYRRADLAPEDRTMLDFAAKLTRSPAAMVREDVDGLRAAGFDDRAILQITLIASWFAYLNRVADALGVGKT